MFNKTDRQAELSRLEGLTPAQFRTECEETLQNWVGNPFGGKGDDYIPTAQERATALAGLLGHWEYLNSDDEG